MNVKVADSAGFCFGVERAVKLVYDESEVSNTPVYTYGPIIHNEQVVSDLMEKGVNVVHTCEELKTLPKGTIIVRSHGIDKATQEAMEESGFRILDATCPFVKKIHKIVERESAAGRVIIIIGNKKHPEVQGIKGWCDGEVYIIENEEEAMALDLPEDTKVCIVSQTTFNYKKFEDLVEIISKKRYDILALNTICNATEVRQKEAKELARLSDVMLVVGGEHSSNTQKLYEICRKECENTYYIQTVADLDCEKFESFQNVGITAGASTPNKIIEEVQKACQK